MAEGDPSQAAELLKDAVKLAKNTKMQAGYGWSGGQKANLVNLLGWILREFLGALKKRKYPWVAYVGWAILKGLIILD